MKITKEQIKLFKSEVKRWQKSLGLQRYKVHAMASEMDAFARALVSEPDQVAVISINVNAEGYNDDQVKRAALHECLEVLFHEITNELEKHCADSVVDTMVHRALRALEFVLADAK